MVLALKELDERNIHNIFWLSAVSRYCKDIEVDIPDDLIQKYNL